LRSKPVEERTLDLVRIVYWGYWGANLKGVEQPSESDNKQDKNEGDTFFVGMSMNKEHEVAIASAEAFSKSDAEGQWGQYWPMLKLKCSDTEQGANNKNTKSF